MGLRWSLTSEPSLLRWSLTSGIQYFYKEEGKRHQDGCGQMQSISPGPPGWMWTDAVYISWISCPGWMWTDAVYISWASWMDVDRCSLYLLDLLPPMVVDRCSLYHLGLLEGYGQMQFISTAQTTTAQKR